MVIFASTKRHKKVGRRDKILRERFTSPWDLIRSPDAEEILLKRGEQFYKKQKMEV